MQSKVCSGAATQSLLIENRSASDSESYVAACDGYRMMRSLPISESWSYGVTDMLPSEGSHCVSG